MATVLIVEDYAVTRRMLSYTLQQEGHTVVTAMHGKDALRHLAETVVDIAIVDIAMPEMDGLTLLKLLRANERYKNLPIIMLTASGQDADRIQARAEGANDFLSKPTSSRELLESVNRLLG
jgi:CheY-like chemotaxis protein